MKRDFSELLAEGKSDFESCRIIANGEGETIVITKEFARVLYNMLSSEN